MTRLVDAASFTVPVANFVQRSVEKNSVENAKMEGRLVRPAEAVEE